MNRSPETFTTARMILRPPELTDAQAIFDTYAADPEVKRYLAHPPAESPAEVETFLERCLNNWETGRDFAYILEERLTGEILGMIELFDLLPHRVELGYVLGRKYWGQGYVPEAGKAIIQWVLNNTRIQRVWATCDPENTPSQRVMEKLGLTYEGRLQRWIYRPMLGEVRDVLVYARIIDRKP